MSDHAFYEYKGNYKNKSNKNINEEDLLEKSNNLIEKNLEKEINSCNKIIDKIKSFDYDFLYKYFFKYENFNNKNKEIDKIKESFDKTGKNIFIKEALLNSLQQKRNYLEKFLQIFLDQDINYLKEISSSILKFDNNFNWNFNFVLNEIIILNNDISSLFYNILRSVEKYLKSIIQHKMVFNKINFRDIEKEFKLKDLFNFKKIKNHADMNDNSKKISIVLSYFTWQEIIKLILTIKNEKLLNDIFLNIYGDLKINKEKNIYEIKEKLVKDLEIIKELRDKIMHYEYILPTDNNNILMESLKALNSINTVNKNLTNAGFDIPYNQVLNLVSEFLLNMNNEKINIFFQKYILSYEIY